MTTSINNELDQLAQDLLAAWQKAHGLKTGEARALVGPDHLAILIEGAFSQAEKKLAEDQGGEVLLRKYAVELLSQICDEMSARIRQAAGRNVFASDVNANPDTDQIIFIFKLEQAKPGV